MDEGIEIPISLEPSKLVADMKTLGAQAKKSGDQISAGISQGNVAIGKLKTSTQQLVAQLKTSFDKDVYNAFMNGSRSVYVMTEALQTLKENMTLATNPADIQRYNIAIKDLQRNILELQTTGTGNIFQKMGLQGNGGFGSIINQLRQIAYIIPGIGIAGIISALLSPLQSLISGLSDTADNAKDAGVQLDYLHTVLERFGKEADNMKGRFDFATEIQKLQAQLKFGSGINADILGLKKEQTNVKSFSDYAEIRLKQLENKLKENKQLLKTFNITEVPGVPLQDLPETAFDNIPGGLKATESTKSLLKSYKEIYKQIQDLQQQKLKSDDSFNKNEIDLQIKYREQLKKILEDQYNLYKDAQERRIDLNKKLFEATGMQKARDDQYNAEVDLIKRRTAFELSQDNLTEAGKKRILQKESFDLEDALRSRESDIRNHVQKVMQEYDKIRSSAALNTGKNINISLSDIENVDRLIDEISQNIKTLSSINGKIFGADLNSEIDGLKERLELLKEIKKVMDLMKAPGQTKAERDLFDNNNLYAQAQRQFQQFGRKGNEGLNNAFNPLQSLEKNEKALNEMLQKLLNLKQVGQVIGEGLSNAFDKTFDAILDGKNAFKALGEAIKDLVVEIIKAIAKMLIMAAVKNLILPGSGSLSFGGGGGHGLPHFAAGGVVYGPTLGLIGEGSGTNRSNPEVVAPLDQLTSIFRNMIGLNRGSAYSGGTMVQQGGVKVVLGGEVIVRQSGRDMVGVLALENASQRRGG